MMRRQIQQLKFTDIKVLRKVSEEMATRQIKVISPVPEGIGKERR